MLKLRPKTKRNIQRLLPFALIWVLSGWIFLIVELAASGSYSQLPATAIKMDASIFILSSVALAGVGLLTGFIELNYLSHIFIYRKFALRFLYKFLIYSALFLVVVLITFPVAASFELDTPLFDQRVWGKYFDYFSSITHLSTAIQLTTALVISLFYAEISEFMGQGVLLNFFTGKYHTPQEEERIFMFVDMKASTTIAERLGHLAYFQLLREYYYCFSDAIIENEGEIYQYVGDEIILSWKVLPAGSDSRCVDCFFAMKESLRKKAPWFQKKFGVIPTFKAGIHLGKVTAGEIGAIKKEILFSGDVLNATARLQGLCNDYGVELIASSKLVKQLNLSDRYPTHELGESALRGKETAMNLCTIYDAKE